jgi:hypothetical protein
MRAPQRHHRERSIGEGPNHGRPDGQIDDPEKADRDWERNTPAESSGRSARRMVLPFSVLSSGRQKTFS